MGTQLPPPTKKGTAAPTFAVYGRSQAAAHVYCGQTDGWVKMPLGMEVSLGPDDTVLEGDLALPMEKGTAAPHPLFGHFAVVRSPISATASSNVRGACVSAYSDASDVVFNCTTSLQRRRRAADCSTTPADSRHVPDVRGGGVRRGWSRRGGAGVVGRWRLF